MKEVLSPEELSGLLTAVDDGPASAQSAERHIQAHDFQRPLPLSGSRRRELHNLHDTLAVVLSRTLGAHFSAPVEVTLVTIEVVTYGAFNAALPSPICLQPFDISLRGHRGLLAVDMALAMCMLQRLLGHHGQAIDQARPLTAVERAIMAGPCAAMVDAIATAWSAATPLQLHPHPLVIDPKAVQFLGAQESVLQILFAVGGDVGVGDLSLCFPTALAAHLIPSENTPLHSDEDHRAALRRAIGAAPVRVAAELGRTTITVRQLLGLEPGHVVRLEHRVTEPALITVEGKARLRGRPGLVGRRLGLQITHTPQPDPEGGDPS